MEIQHNVLLKKYTTFKTGGFARLFCVVESVQDVIEALEYVSLHAIPFYILGGGSNTLVSEKGFDGLVIHIALQGTEYEEIDEKNVRVKVASGVEWDMCVADAVGRGLYGLENLSLIPGSVGASPIQNIGAYGVEVKDIIESVEVYNIQSKKIETLLNNECVFTYRDSIFKKDAGKKYIVLSVTFVLSKNGILKTDYKDIESYFTTHGGDATLQSVRDAIIDIRTKKLPDLHVYGTAGSFFKNPIINREVSEQLQKKFPTLPLYDMENISQVKTSAAFLIDKVAQMRGARVDDVGTFQNQALVLVNYGNATGEEVLAFSDYIQKTVFEKSGIVLEREVQTLGF